MAEEAVARTLREYGSPSMDDVASCIRKPAIQANNFEIKPTYIQMIQQSVQFSGLPNENPNEHLTRFLEICDIFKYNGVSEDAKRLRLFSFSLRDKAKNWEEMSSKFLGKYFPPSKTAKMRNDITTFMQFDTESLHEAWE
ncbi:hypothetical protein SLA2020_040060 [Shorea laevis]